MGKANALQARASKWKGVRVASAREQREGHSFRVFISAYSPDLPSSYYDIYKMGFGYLDRFTKYKPTSLFNGGFYKGFFMIGWDRQYFITIGSGTDEGYQYLLNLYKK